MRTIILIAVLAFILPGCGKFSPFSPEHKQQIDNNNGQIEDIKNNQQGMMLDLMNLRQQNEINAKNIDNFQQGLANVNRSNDNSGVQILQGDGALVLVFALGVVGMLVIYHYKTRAQKSEKVAEIMAQQITCYNDENLDEKVYSAALNTDVECEIYHLMTKNKKK